MRQFDAKWFGKRLEPCIIDEITTIPNSRNIIYKIATASETYFLKLHCQYKHWCAEIYAYRNWLIQFPGNFPELIDIYNMDEQFGLLTSEIRGSPLEGMFFSTSIEKKAWYQAGKLSAILEKNSCGQWFGVPNLFGKPKGFSTRDPIKYIQYESEKWINCALQLNLLGGQELEMAHWLRKHYHSFAEEKPVLINGDYAPGNWLVDEKGQFLGAVDFEETCWGFRVETFAHLWTKYARYKQIQCNEFFRGYGDNIWKRYPVQSRIVCIRLAIATLILAHEKENEMYLSRATSIFKWLADTWEKDYPW